jgi:sulfopyruvate decarboxylase TPP-binding subunit
LKLIRTAREGEAIALAGGLILGGAKPLVVIQCTGLFEAGDALRNVVHDLNLPIQLLVGVRSHRAAMKGKSNDNCPIFTEPIIQAWKLKYDWFDSEHQNESDLMTRLRQLQRDGAGVILWPE